eukprot:6172269-Pleurochrysis_carterae.AAC.1
MEKAARRRVCAGVRAGARAVKAAPLCSSGSTDGACDATTQMARADASDELEVAGLGEGRRGIEGAERGKRGTFT